MGAIAITEDVVATTKIEDGTFLTPWHIKFVVQARLEAPPKAVLRVEAGNQNAEAAGGDHQLHCDLAASPCVLSPPIERARFAVAPHPQRSRTDAQQQRQHGRNSEQATEHADILRADRQWLQSTGWIWTAARFYFMQCQPE